MKASGLVISILLAVIPAISLFVTGLTEQGLITAAIAEAVGIAINLVAKVVQEKKTSRPPAAASRSLAPDGTVSATPSLWKRVLLG